MGHVFGGKARLDGVENTGCRVVRFSARDGGRKSVADTFEPPWENIHRAFPHGVAGGPWRLRWFRLFPSWRRRGTMEIEVVQVVSLMALQRDYGDCWVRVAGVG